MLGTPYVLVAELRCRQIIFVNGSAHPDAGWMSQQAGILACELQDAAVPPRLLIQDRDTK